MTQPIGRKIIQICGDQTLTALCDDGSVWQLTPINTWQLLPQIPDFYDHDRAFKQQVAEHLRLACE